MILQRLNHPRHRQTIKGRTDAFHEELFTTTIIFFGNCGNSNTTGNPKNYRSINNIVVLTTVIPATTPVIEIA